MALIKCHECGAEISSGAKACPHCGAKRKSQAGKLFLVFIILGFVISVTMCIINSTNQSENAKLEAARLAAMTPEQRATEAKEQQRRHEDNLRYDAARACRGFIEKHLKDPDSVQFPDDSPNVADKQNDGTYRTVFMLRAKNSFGALVPSYYDCRLKQAGDGWVLIKLKEVSAN